MMRLSALVTLLCAGIASAATSTTTSIKPGAVTAHIAPHQAAPSGCSPNYSGTFEIGPVNVSSSSSSSKRSLRSRDTPLGITLINGILTDPYGRTGYIASNQQFQFDGPPQAGAIWTAGFSICPNGSLALGNDVTWWSCLSGTFYNLYFDKIGGQCIESYIVAYGVDGGHYESVTGSTSAPTYSTSASSSAASSKAAGNATVSSSSSMGASNSSASASSGIASHHNHTRLMTTTKKGPFHTTHHHGSPVSGTASASSSGSATSSAQGSSGSGNAAPSNSMFGAVVGVAGGLFAFAALL